MKGLLMLGALAPPSRLLVTPHSARVRCPESGPARRSR